MVGELNTEDSRRTGQVSRAVLRVLLVSYLTIATTAGPRLCPCSMPLPTPVSEPKSPSPADRAPRSCACCPTKPATPTPTAQTFGHQNPDQPSAPCPCQCGKPDSVANARAAWRAHAPTDDPNTGPAYGTPLADFAPHVCSIASTSGPGRNLPFYTTDDLLHAFHFLRC